LLAFIDGQGNDSKSEHKKDIHNVKCPIRNMEKLEKFKDDSVSNR